MDDRDFLLDTEALRSLPFAVIRGAVAAGLHLSVSPISVWELLTHLDETNRKVGFDMCKGWLLKARELHLLDDPFADHAIRVAAAGVAHESRFDDAPILHLVLDRLVNAATLDDFYNATVSYKGEERRIRDSAARARKTLTQAQKDFVDQLRRMVLIIEEKIGRATARSVSDEQYVVVASAGTLKLASFYEDHGYKSQDLVARVFESVYPHLGYVFERARQYVLNFPTSAEIRFDENDAEDGMLCLHLGLAERRVLVTNDKGTRRALSEATSRVQRALAEHGTSATFNLVMSCDEFTSIVKNTKPTQLTPP